MDWLEHPILRELEAMKPPALSPLPPLTPIELSHVPILPTDDLINPDERYMNN
jgi:hypothetical protein